MNNPATQATPVTNSDDMPVDAPWTEDQVLAALYRHFSKRDNGNWACHDQVTTHDDEGTTGDEALHRRIDMLLIRRDQRTRVGLETLALEVKVTRQDFLSDVNNPAKQAVWRASATRHAFVAPPGIIRAGEVPEGCGVYEVERLVPARADSPTSINTIVAAPYNPDPSHMPGLITSTLYTLMLRGATAQADLKGWGAVDLAGSERELRQRVRHAENNATKAYRERDSAIGKAEAWKSAYAAAAPDGLPCRWCEEPIKPLRPGASGFGAWRHADKAADQLCRAAELADRTAAARRAYWGATVAEREREVRRFNAYANGEDVVRLLEAEPWRAFLTTTARKPEPDVR